MEALRPDEPSRRLSGTNSGMRAAQGTPLRQRRLVSESRIRGRPHDVVIGTAADGNAPCRHAADWRARVVSAFVHTLAAGRNLGA